MKNFIHHDLPKLIQINSNGTRVYQTPDGQNYPSVTTILGYFSAPNIQKWRQRVGEEEANKVSSRASKRGTSTHTLCENYLKGKELYIDIFDKEMFFTLKPHLDKINNIHALETKLFSHKIKTAGTVDCIGEYDGVLSIIDFKSSLKLKRKEWIENYFMQCGAYSYMFWELTGILITNITVLIGVDHHDAQVFQEPVTPWLNKFINLRNEYKKIKGI